MRSAFTFASFALIGCTTEETTLARLTPVDASAPISIQLHDTMGSGTFPVSVRQVNSFGVGVSGGTARVAVRGGATIPAGTVTFDASGYGTVDVTVPDATIAQIQVQPKHPSFIALHGSNARLARESAWPTPSMTTLSLNPRWRKS